MDHLLRDRRAGLAALAALAASVLLDIPALRRGSLKMLDLAGIAFFGTLCVLALVPFTEQYARESTPPEVWGTPAFKRTNRLLTAMWGSVFAITAILSLVAVHDGRDAVWLDWVVPIVLLVIAVRVTRWYPAHVRQRQQEVTTGG